MRPPNRPDAWRARSAGWPVPGRQARPQFPGRRGPRQDPPGNWPPPPGGVRVPRRPFPKAPGGLTADPAPTASRPHDSGDATPALLP